MFASWNARAVGLNLTARESIEIAAGAGFSGVDLLVRDILESGTDPVDLRNRMDDLGLRGGAWPLPVNWRGSEESFQNDLRLLPRYAQAAAILGLKTTGTWVLPETIAWNGDARTSADPIERTTAFHVDRLGQIARILANHGCSLGLEILGPRTARTGLSAPYIATYRQLAKRLQALRKGWGNVGMLADAFHLFAAGEACEAGMVWGSGSVVWVHLADADHIDLTLLQDHERALPGAHPWSNAQALLELLSTAGYAGPVTVEPLGRCSALAGRPPEDAARHVLLALKQVWPADSA